MKDVNKYIDHTLLRSDATKSEIVKLCEEAVKYGFFSVCINTFNILYAVPLLKNTEVKICTVIGFPLGADIPGIKAMIAKEACKAGADELDMVLNIGAMKDGHHNVVSRDIQSVVEVAKINGALTKVILETSLLTDREIISACDIAKSAGADFIKTSSGYSPKNGATVHAVSLIKDAVGNSMGIKASGGIKDRKTAISMIEAGATRIGTSRSLDIIKE